MKKFTEARLEQSFTELLGQEGFPHHLGITITPKPDEVLIKYLKMSSEIILYQNPLGNIKKFGI